MKKKILMMAAVCVLALSITACGSGNGQETSAAETVETEAEGTAADADAAAETPEGTEAETTKPDLSKVDPKEALGPGAFDTDEDSEEMKNYEALLDSDYQGFAEQVVAVFEGKDMEALADLMHYPSYVSCVEENSGIVTDRETLLGQDPDKIFDDALVASLKEADLEQLEPLVAGIVIGDDTFNVVFNIRDGKLGITGINE